MRTTEILDFFYQIFFDLKIDATTSYRIWFYADLDSNISITLIKYAFAKIKFLTSPPFHYDKFYSKFTVQIYPATYAETN